MAGLKLAPMKILIGSPTYDGSVRKEYMRAVMVLTDYFRQSGIEWELRLEAGTLLHVMRSVMASNAVATGCTHLLFIDTDMGFTVGAVRKLIAANRDVIGVAYPYRTVPLHENVAEAGRPLRQVVSEMVPYAVTLPPGKEVTVRKGIVEVNSLGTGLLLISTQALKAMQPKVGRYRNHFPYEQWHKPDHYWGFFDPVTTDGRQMGEDYSFCWRWRKDCGGKVYAVVDEEVMHVGPLPVLGRYLDRIKTGKL
jgi:hypothetical protein